MLTLPARHTVRSLSAIVPAIGMFWAFHSNALAGWWTSDDPCLLAAVDDHGIGAHFLDPQVWQGLSSNVFMPWQLLSLGIDWKLFGLSPAPFFWHHLLSFTAVLVLAFLVGRRWISSASCGIGLLWFVASVPAFGVSQQLMNRHYIEGLGLALASVLLYSPELESLSRRRTLSALLFFAACAAKEVFVPLPLLLATFPGSETQLSVDRLRGTLRRIAPHLWALGLYLIWRLLMLGSSVAVGYQTRTSSFGFDEFSGVLSLLVPGNPTTTLTGTFLIFGLAIVLYRRFPRWRLLILTTPIAVIGPWVGVFPHMAPRHLLIPALFVSWILATALDLIPSRRVRWVAYLSLFGLSLTIFDTSTHRDLQQASYRHHRTEGEWILYGEAGTHLETTLNDSAFLSCLANLRGETEGPGYCGDPCWCRSSETMGPTEAWLRYEGGTLGSAAPPTDCEVRNNLVAEFEFDTESDQVSWQLGPWDEERFSVLLISSAATPAVSVPIPIPSRGRVAWPGDHQFVARYESPEGWIAYSPKAHSRSQSKVLGPQP